MHTLHILNKSPDHPRTAQCLKMISPEDGLLLMGGAVLFLSTGGLPETGKIFALTADVDARGVGHLSGNTSTVDYTEMVALSLQAERVISW